MEITGKEISTRQRLTRLLPWLITALALYFTFRGLDWQLFLSHLGNARPEFLTLVVFLTGFSYFLRARRWQHLFPSNTISYLDSLRVLILGFFMNNLLPARTGELVRAHMGSKVTKEPRTLVLATVAAERLADGLVISLMFILFAFGLGDQAMSRNLFYVACLFVAVAIVVAVALAFRSRLFTLAEQVSGRFNHRASQYTLDRFQIFFHGLTPLFSLRRVPRLIVWSILIWMVELFVFCAVTRAYVALLSIPVCVLFLVAVNFSSLIPAAPGALGVIEAVGTAALMSVGVPKELALTMVITQHAVQYLVVGIPGALVLFTWKRQIHGLTTIADDEPRTASS